MVRLGLLGVAAMAMLVAGILLARNTTGHDWYSAGKLTLHEAMLTVGFSEHKPVAYRTNRGDTWKIIRVVLVEHGPLVRARRRILTTIGEGVLLGAGAGGAVFCLMLLGAVRHRRRGRAVATVEPAVGAYPYRPPPAWGRAGHGHGWFRPGGGRAGLVVIPVAEIEDVERFVAHGGSPGPVTAVGPGAGAVEHPPALPAIGAAPDGADTGPTLGKDAAKPAPGRAGKPRKQVSGPHRGSGTSRSDGKTPARRQTRAPSKPDGDGDFF